MLAQRRKPGPAGFTLIELLAVMAIIGVLAGLAISLSGRARAQAQVAATRAQLEKVKLALEEYRLEYGRYPQATNGAGMVDILYAIPKSRLQEAFIEFDEGDLEGTNIWKDAWGQEFRYNGVNPTRNPDSFDLSSAGPNGRDNDEDDLVN